MQCRSGTLRLPFCFFPPAFAHLLLRNLLLLECLCQDKVGLILRSASKLCNRFNPSSLCGVDCISLSLAALTCTCMLQSSTPARAFASASCSRERSPATLVCTSRTYRCQPRLQGALPFFCHLLCCQPLRFCFCFCFCFCCFCCFCAHPLRSRGAGRAGRKE